MTAVFDPHYNYVKTAPLIELEHVNLSLGGRQIIRDLSAQVLNIERPNIQQGQVVCVLGPSGIGKTQIARMIAGLRKPTSGQIRVHDGHALVPVTRGLVGMVPQNYPLFDFETVWGNLMIAAKYGHGQITPALLDKAKELLDEFGLTPYKDYYPRDLSGGTRQRAAIVRQMMCSDHCVIMDEPFSGLDLIMKKRACEVIQHVATLDSSNTIFVNTHDVTEGMSIADTVWLIGREQAPDGTYLEGARVVKEYDLAADGLCWHPDIMTMPLFQERVQEVKAKFQTLIPPVAH